MLVAAREPASPGPVVDEHVASRMLSCPVRIRASWPASLAAITMDRCGLRTALVCDDHETPLGWLTGAVPAPTGATVGEAIDEPLAWVAPDAPLADARAGLAAAGVSRALVRPHADGAVLGVVTVAALA
jgi:hypothetical protein